MTSNLKKMAILVGGGPAPGINSVISAATIRSNLEGVEVLGVQDGFKWLMRGDVSRALPLTMESIGRIHFHGGSHLGVSREYPSRNQKLLETTVTSLLRLNVDKLVTIGGDATLESAMKIEQMAAGSIRVAHVPKTIDNDLDLPHGLSTVGFQTARHVGVEIVKNLMVDANTTSRWYFVVTIGRKAGHLALGIGNAAGVNLTVIPEELGAGVVRLGNIVDILVGAIIKRLSYGYADGVALLAEGLVARLDPQDLAGFTIERDAQDNIRLTEVNFGEILKYHVMERLKPFNLKPTIVAKNIGYEMRCADPIPFDMEYTRDLGFCAARFLLQGGNAAMVSIQNSHFVPMYFDSIVDPNTKKLKIRMVNTEAEAYQIARHYMLRLNKSDFDDPFELARYAATCGISLEEFRSHFLHLLDEDVFNKAPAATG